MKIHCYLVVTSGGSVRAVKNRPGLGSDEISIGLNLELPNALFQRPQLAATLVVPQSAVNTPEISMETVDGVKQAIEQSTGFDVRISIAEAPE